MKPFIYSLAVCLTGLLPANSWSQSEVNKAYQHLYKIMDKHHTSFEVYTDRDGGGNRFIPTIIGDWQSIKLNDNYHDGPKFDATSMRIDYTPRQNDKYGWAATNWLFPDTNWGYWLGHDLRGATRLKFLARGERGGEKVEFLLGGINRPPDHVASRKYMDTVDKLSTGIVNLSTNWQEYAIDLTATSYFAVYLDGDAGSNNRYIPSGWMNGAFNMKLDPMWTQKPHSGSSCIRVEWNGMSGSDGSKWNAVMWQYPEGNWKDVNGHNLSGATQLTFWAKTDEPGLELQFQVGGRDDSSGEVFIKNQWVKIDTEWQQYTIDLTGKNLSNIRGGFAFAFNNVHDPNPDGTVFYLDDIVFNKPLSKDLTNVIAGFGSAVSKRDNPAGCTFYLDDVRYELSAERLQKRLREPHFLASYVTVENDTFDQRLRNTAFLYDNALALLTFLHRATPEDLWRADVLARTFIFCQNYDRDFQGQAQDYRLRNAYRAGDLIEPEEGWARLPFYFDESAKVVRQDPFNSGSATGNLTWTMIALLYHREQRISSNRALADSSLQASIRLGKWILDNCYAEDAVQGYFGGIEFKGAQGFVKIPWKSTEHNLDAFVAFTKLFEATKDSVWHKAAQRAKRFVMAMYNNNGPFFWIGTTNATQINQSPLVEDVQTWSYMVLRDSSHSSIIQWVMEKCGVKHHGFEGIDFDTDRDGIWFEGTAHTALALWMTRDVKNYDHFIAQLRMAQEKASRTDSLGIVAACHDGISTGLDWKYYNRLHIGATAWYIFAENKWNPYWQDFKTGIDTRDAKLFPLKFTLSQNYPNPFNPSTQLRFDLPKSERVSLRIYSITGQLVRTLFDRHLSAGTHDVIWDGRTNESVVVASGVYFAVLHAGEEATSIKLVLTR